LDRSSNREVGMSQRDRVGPRDMTLSQMGVRRDRSSVAAVQFVNLVQT